MSKETTQDQAEHLKELFNEIEHSEREEVSTQDGLHAEPENVQVLKIDILNLPPRKEIHSMNNNRTRLKLGKPLIRLLLVIVVLIVIIIGSYYLWDEQLIQLINNL